MVGVSIQYTCILTMVMVVKYDHKNIFFSSVFVRRFALSRLLVLSHNIVLCIYKAEKSYNMNRLSACDSSSAHSSERANASHFSEVWTITEFYKCLQ